jgi:hypothetical protein
MYDTVEEENSSSSTKNSSYDLVKMPGRKKCEHGKRRNQCIPCGGASICEHSKRRSTCKLCKTHKSGMTKIVPVGCQCSDRDRTVALITGYHPPENGCDYREYQCISCKHRSRYQSWMAQHRRMVHHDDE